MQPETYFAPAQRAEQDVLNYEIDFVSHHPIIDCLMQTISGLFAVLDEHRQIVAVNKTILEVIGITDASKVFGLRPGEALNCIHAQDEPHGCGTTKFCSSCGAAIAIVASLKNDTPEERICAATIQKENKEINLCFKVRSAPVILENQRFLLLFMQDITHQQNWSALERTFFHDVNNILTGVLGTREVMAFNEQTRPVSDQLSPLLLRLKNEIALQRVLSSSKDSSYEPTLQEITLGQVEKELTALFAHHPTAKGKFITFTSHLAEQKTYTDYSLLMRTLTNMIINALEATKEGGTVEFWTEHKNTDTTFYVWNEGAIPPNVQLRIFQRHFSTKKGEGRGIGTFSMKLFGEQFLKGKVNFTSSPDEGTLFRLSLPS